MNPIVYVLSGATGAAIVTGGPAWFLIHAQRQRVEVAALHEAAETDSVIVTTTDRLVGIVNSQIERVTQRVAHLEDENNLLRMRHERCESDLRAVNVRLLAEQSARSAMDQRLDRMLVDADVAMEERKRLAVAVAQSQHVIAELREQITVLTDRVDATDTAQGSDAE